jgi:RimK family alpha-L-glutamate ligase
MRIDQPIYERRTEDPRHALPLVAVLGGARETNSTLVEEWLRLGIPALSLTPREAAGILELGDTALGRLDVRPALDGIEEGLDTLDELRERGVRVLNGRTALIRAHDKLQTSRIVAAARIPHPKTVFLPRAAAPRGLRPPLVVKPRFGSWGVDVFRCYDDNAVNAVLAEIRDRPWFRRHGALLQELVPTSGYDARLLVAGGRVVGGVKRVAAPGEWRTNVAHGAVRRPLSVTPEMSSLAIGPADAIGADFVGVDLLPVDGGHVVLEVNGAVDFNRSYDIDGNDVCAEIAVALGFAQPAQIRNP